MQNIILIGRRPSPAAMSYTKGSKTKLQYSVNNPSRNSPLKTAYGGKATNPEYNRAIQKYNTDAGFKARVDDRIQKRMGEGPKSKNQTTDFLMKLATRASMRACDKLMDNLTGTDHGITPSVAGESRPVMPTVAVHGKRKYEMMNTSENRLIHKTEYVTGYKPSKGVYEAARTNGTGYAVMYDSKMNSKGETERNALTQSAGFNSKSFHIPMPRMQISKREVESLMLRGYTDSALLSTPFVESQSDRRAVYVSVMNLKRQFMIHNTSAFFPMHFKICIAKYEGKEAVGGTYVTTAQNAAQSIAELAAVDTAISTNAPIPTNNGKVPWQYQHIGLTKPNEPAGSSSTYVDAAFSLKGRGIMESRSWKDSVKIIESFEKVIPPGDFWNFSHVHNLGGGIELQDFAEELISGDGRDTRQDPFTYLIWFESKGVLCEGVFQNTTSFDTYIGTSPTYWSYECKTSAYYVTEKVVGTEINANLQSFKIHRREFSSDPVRSFGATNTTVKEFFVAPANIVANSTGLAVGQLYVPIISKGDNRVAYNTSGNAG